MHPHPLSTWHKPGTLTFPMLPQEEPASGKGKIKPRGDNSGKKKFFFFSYHINNLELSIGEDNGIGRSCHGEHEGQRCSECAGQHDIERVEANCFSLCTKTEQRWWLPYPEMHRNLIVHVRSLILPQTLQPLVFWCCFRRFQQVQELILWSGVGVAAV